MARAERSSAAARATRRVAGLLLVALLLAAAASPTAAGASRGRACDVPTGAGSTADAFYRSSEVHLFEGALRSRRGARDRKDRAVHGCRTGRGPGLTLFAGEPVPAGGAPARGRRGFHLVPEVVAERYVAGWEIRPDGSQTVVVWDLVERRAVRRHAGTSRVRSLSVLANGLPVALHENAAGARQLRIGTHTVAAGAIDAVGVGERDLYWTEGGSPRHQALPPPAATWRSVAAAPLPRGRAPSAGRPCEEPSWADLVTASGRVSLYRSRPTEAWGDGNRDGGDVYGCLEGHGPLRALFHRFSRHDEDGDRPFFSTYGPLTPIVADRFVGAWVREREGEPGDRAVEQAQPRTLAVIWDLARRRHRELHVPDSDAHFDALRLHLLADGTPVALHVDALGARQLLVGTRPLAAGSIEDLAVAGQTVYWTQDGRSRSSVQPSRP